MVVTVKLWGSENYMPMSEERNCESFALFLLLFTFAPWLWEEDEMIKVFTIPVLIYANERRDEWSRISQYQGKMLSQSDVSTGEN
jgi:hypothetical protein